MENTPYLSINLSTWAKFFDFSLPEFSEDYFLSVADFVEPVSHEWDYDEYEGLPEEFWGIFRSAFDISPSIPKEEIMLDLNSSYSDAWYDDLYKSWVEAVRDATEKVFGFIDINSYPPVNCTGDWENPPMKVDSSFPPLKWEIKDHQIQFFGSPAPLVYLGIATLNGLNGARFSGIREWMDTYGDGAVEYAARLCATELPSVFGIPISTDYGDNCYPSWSIHSAIKEFKSQGEVYASWFLK